MSIPTPVTASASATPSQDRREWPKAPWRLAVLLAVGAAASGILLTGVSVWFLGAVALAGLGPAAFAFNFHIPAAFIRLFALAKTVGKYGERVTGHRAALLDQVRRRSKLFTAMAGARSTRAAGWQLGNQDRLADYMDDVEDVDYARLRVGMPALVLMAGAAALTAGTAWLVSWALLPIALGALSAGLTLGILFPKVMRDWSTVRASQRSAEQRLGAALAAVTPLQAERAFSPVLGQAFAGFEEAETARLVQRRGLAAFDLVTGLIGPLAALSVLLAAWYGGSRNGALLVPAFLAFGWLALGETAQGVSRMVLGRVREKAAQSGLSGWTVAGEDTAGGVPAPTMRSLRLCGVPRQSPDGRRLGEPIDLTVRAGEPLALVGCSGVGKTTLLKQIAGWLGNDDDGRFVVDGVTLSAADRRAAAHLGLHDAAVLTDTVRENLFAPQASDADCWHALTAVELDGRIRTAGGLDAWISQDMFSLGEAQRLNLAHALLSNAPLMLLDEPTEHLDPDQASRILQRLLDALSNRIVIFATHNMQAAEVRQVML